MNDLCGAALLLANKYNRMRLTMDELAAELGRARDTISNQIGAGTLCVPTYIEGRTRFADVRAVGAYLDQQHEAALEAFEAARALRKGGRGKGASARTQGLPVLPAVPNHARLLQRD